VASQKDVRRLFSDPSFEYEILDEVVRIQRQMEIAVVVMALMLSSLFVVLAIKVSLYYLAGTAACCLAASNSVFRKTSFLSTDCIERLED
tara:strand:+ start:1938 stop:2207 length:270 start_codon:yes stop_codon:yes gene_type:complete